MSWSMPQIYPCTHRNAPLATTYINEWTAQSEIAQKARRRRRASFIISKTYLKTLIRTHILPYTTPKMFLTRSHTDPNSPGTTRLQNYKFSTIFALLSLPKRSKSNRKCSNSNDFGKSLKRHHLKIGKTHTRKFFRTSGFHRSTLGNVLFHPTYVKLSRIFLKYFFRDFIERI